MTKIAPLNDLQLVLLSHAAKNENGSVLPLPDTAQDEQRTAKELKALLRRKLLAEVDVSDRNQTWRTDDDRLFELVLTEAGREALGLGAEEQTSGDAEPADVSGTAPEPRPGSKIAAVLGLLQREGGSTLDEMIEATGWQSHTARAALTGLRKKGHDDMRIEVGRGEDKGLTAKQPGSALAAYATRPELFRRDAIGGGASWANDDLRIRSSHSFDLLLSQMSRHAAIL